MTIGTALTLISFASLVEKRPHPGNAFVNFIFVVMCETEAQAVVEPSISRKNGAGLKANLKFACFVAEWRGVYGCVEPNPEEIPAVGSRPLCNAGKMLVQSIIHRFHSAAIHAS